MPPSAELAGWVRLAASGGEQVVLRTVHGVHRAVSDGTYRWLGPLGAPIKRIDHAVTDRVYGAIGGTLRAAGSVGASIVGQVSRADPHPSPAANRARAIVNGAVGDDLLGTAPELLLALTVRHGGADLDVDTVTLAEAYAPVSPRIAVFLHGLMDTDAVWSARSSADPVLPEVAGELGFTPVLVRYGTGQPIGENAEALADLLDRLVADWPVPVGRLVLVGHSMGGLVARAACQIASRRGSPWLLQVTDLVALGSPHLGSWLEKTANVTSWSLRAASSRSAPFGALLDERSPGIKDLRFGTLHAADWRGQDPDGLLTGWAPQEPWSHGLTHHLIVGQLREPSDHPLNLIFGDSLVRRPSARGNGFRRRISAPGEVLVTGIPAHHNQLVRDPEVARVLRDVLQGP